tara:strand:+ start:5238 stop:5594 length:357 start_codon:yes stop_codon:yes gene_type:complete
MQTDFMKRITLENEEKWPSIIEEVPSINFDAEWGVRIIPPFGGAVGRFWIMKAFKDSKDERVVSVYLDWYDTLGYFGNPYYELYPWEGDIKRYALTETKQLEADIRTLYENHVQGGEQ